MGLQDLKFLSLILSSIIISPLVGFINPETKSIKVDFPEPLGPNIPIESPLLILKLIFSRTYLFEFLYLK